MFVFINQMRLLGFSRSLHKTPCSHEKNVHPNYYNNNYISGSNPFLTFQLEVGFHCI